MRRARLAPLTVAAALTVSLSSAVGATGPYPVVLAAGDIADCQASADEQTAALLDSLRGTVLALGDNAYESGTLAEYQACYAPSWGRHKLRTRPTPGNHDYKDTDAAGYFSYYGRAAGPARRGYYSFDLGRWHIVSLNSESDTTAGGAQVRWLKRDLARSRADCVLALWHRPRWSGGQYGDDGTLASFWNVLYDARADVVLAAHDHNYQRFARLNKRGRVDLVRGIRSFVVGTGGRHLHKLRSHSRRQAAHDRTFGVLQLTLRPRSYVWRFVPVAGGGYRDSGSANCSPRRP